MTRVPGFDCPAPIDGSTAFDVNNWSRVVGTSIWMYGKSSCFRTAPNEPINPATDRLTFDGGDQSPPYQTLPCIAHSINDNGSVVGTRWNDLSMASFYAHAFVYGSSMVTLSTMLECDTPGQLGCIGNYGFALNSTGTIVGAAGMYHPSGDLFHAFRVQLPVDGCCLDDLGALPLPNSANGSKASAVNDSGVIVGSSWAPPGGVVQRAVLFGEGQAVFDLGTLGGSQCLFCSSAANAINNVTLPKVVGWSTLSVSGPRHAFSRRLALRGDDMVDLGDLCPRSEHGLCRSEAFAINDFGQIVGESETTYGDQSTHALSIMPRLV